ncbi:MAG: hypothetical protein ACU836_03065 [Gammaproteobacteria bacterium]
MNLKMTFAAAAMVMGSASAAHAATYNVDAVFNETMTNGVMTEFHGSFDWDGATVSNFSGLMNVSMRGLWTDQPGHDYASYGPYTAFGTSSDMYPTQNTYWGQVNHLAANGLYMLTLDQNLIQSDNGSTVTASVFRLNTSDVFTGGGYATPAGDFMAYMKYGYNDGNTPNENSFFTMVFDHDAAGNITSLGFQDLAGNATLVNQMLYGDCSVGSLMMGGNACMAGEPSGASMMAGTPKSLEITAAQVAAVPVPAAAWLFGGALTSLFGVSRRKRVLPA